MLQEIIQQNPEEHLTYVLTGESGPDHNKHFTVEVHLNQNVIGKGGGRSKKRCGTTGCQRSIGADGILNTGILQSLFRTMDVLINAAFCNQVSITGIQEQPAP